MPIALLAALAGSLALHAAALFGTDVEWPPADDDAPPPALRAELKPLPPVARASPVPAEAKKRARPAPAKALPDAAPVAAVPEVEPPAPEAAVEPAPAPPPPAVRPVLPESGVIRFAIFKGIDGMRVGISEHRWTFDAEGHYRLVATSQTSGLVALFKSARIEQVSEGRLVADGLQPARFSVRRNGQGEAELADFDWAAGQVRLSRDASTPAIAPGTQDLLSLNYQLVFLPRLAEGTRLGVVTGRKYDRFQLDALGEETLSLPAGEFRTLHLRAQAAETTDIWIALERAGLPVKIRFTDRKGDVYEQVATELGLP